MQRVHATCTAEYAVTRRQQKYAPDSKGHRGERSTYSNAESADSATTFIDVMHQLVSVLLFLVRLFFEESEESLSTDVAVVKMSSLWCDQ